MVPAPPQEIRRGLYKWGAAQRSLQVRVGRQGLLLSPPHPTPPQPTHKKIWYNWTSDQCDVSSCPGKAPSFVIIPTPPHPTPPHPNPQSSFGLVFWCVCAHDPDLCAQMMLICVRRWSVAVCADDPDLCAQMIPLPFSGKRSTCALVCTVRR